MKENVVPIFFKEKWINTISEFFRSELLRVNDHLIYTYHFKKKYGIPVITMPPLVPYMGPFFNFPDNQKAPAKYSMQVKLINKAIEQIPKHKKLVQYFHPSNNNILPFSWNQYIRGSRSTFILDNISDPESLKSNFKESLRRELKKAASNLNIVFSNDCLELYSLKVKDSKAKKIKIDFSLDYLKSITKLVTSNSWGSVLYAKDQNNKVHAGALIVWDDLSGYYLMGAVDQNFKTSGAISLILFEAIKHCSKHCDNFDFEGSQNENIAKYFSGFGGTLTPYSTIKKSLV